MTSIRTRRLATAELAYKQEVDRIERESRDDYGNEHHLAMIKALKAADSVDQREGLRRIDVSRKSLERASLAARKTRGSSSETIVNEILEALRPVGFDE